MLALAVDDGTDTPLKIDSNEVPQENRKLHTFQTCKAQHVMLHLCARKWFALKGATSAAHTTFGAKGLDSTVPKLVEDAVADLLVRSPMLTKVNLG